jgi:membrane associated rhomboid family serine protease
VIPLRDVIPTRTFPAVTIAIIVLNSVAFLYEQSLGDAAMQGLLPVFAVVPSHFMWPTLVTSMFLHAGWLHFLGNMLYLWIFGDNVEERLGHGRFIVFYLACGVIAGLAHVYMNPTSSLPTLGASGAIAGVLGAYFVEYPRARVLTWFFVFVLYVPAWIILGYWFVLQFLGGAATSLAYEGRSMGGVAFWAHVGGFIAGVVMIKLFPERQRRYPYATQ